MDNSKPGEVKTNRQHLEEELGDLAAMITLLEMNGVISQFNIEKAKLAKFDKLKKWSTIYEQD
jgi:NTP pyrophosphatase (non-canonical NTP hydrolase)